MPISKQLRDIINASGRSANDIAKATGIPQPTISRFLAGAEMRSGTIDVIAEHFQLQLAPLPVKAGKAKPAKKREGK